MMREGVHGSGDQSEEHHSPHHNPMHGSQFTEAIWTVITTSLRLLDQQINEERAHRTHGFFINAYD